MTTDTQSIIGILNLVVLTLTLFALFRYAAITNRLQKSALDQLNEMARQRRLSVMPTMLPELKHETGDDIFYLTNIGHGIAVNIRIEEIKYVSKSLPSSYVRFDEVSMLRPGETVRIKSEDFLEARPRGQSNVLAHFKKQVLPSKVATVLVEFHFQDIEGEEYEQVYQMGETNKHLSLKLKSNHQPESD